VLFPEKIDGEFVLLERPNTVVPERGGAVSGDVVELRTSTDLARWRTVGPVLRGRPHSWDELIGPGPPPLKTEFGWLLLYHGVATHLSAGIYQVGAALLDLADPTRVIARTRDNILEPREPWELTGQVPNVVFPTGTVTEPPREDGTYSPDCNVNVVYGAADTCVGVAAATVAELVAACRAGG
jgi:beta-1,4-mannooligosaccharide/beta-1,4-mannosyl-N-acetylglucosamine phosphorylase